MCEQFSQFIESFKGLSLTSFCCFKKSIIPQFLKRSELEKNNDFSFFGQVLFQNISCPPQGELHQLKRQLVCSLLSQHPLFLSDTFPHSLHNWFLEHIPKQGLIIKNMRIHNRGTSEQLLQVILDGCTSEKYPLLTPK